MLNPLSTNPTKLSNTLKQFVGKLPTNCLSVFDHFVGLALKGLIIAGDGLIGGKTATRDFWRIANSVLNKGKSAIPPLFKGPEVLSSASDKAKLFAKNFSKNSNLDHSGYLFTCFPF